MTQAHIIPKQQITKATIHLASSKSESNRALIIDALTGFGGVIDNLSSARDTQTMMRLLHANEPTADVLDAGTTMRFLTAYFAATNQTKIMTGTPRMCERPIGILVDALRILGADIVYLNKEGYPPFKINGFKYSGQHTIQLRGDVSSQYISALLMIAPTLPNGLTIELTTEVGSQPYIEMTLAQMAHFGIKYSANWSESCLIVDSQSYEPTRFQVESDWSGASYWYSLVALAADIEIELMGLKPQSLQGDSAIQHIMALMGVKSVFTDSGVVLSKTVGQPHLIYDFTSCPDLAQTVAVCAAVKGISVEMTGIESLKIKETDRVLALQTELPKVGGELVEIEKNNKYIVRQVTKLADTPTPIVIDTYDDHRMAMAFAPVGVLHGLVIQEPDVVNKSYPSFWTDLAKVTTVSDY